MNTAETTWYFAARFERLGEVAVMANAARMRGIQVNSRWLGQDPSAGYAGSAPAAFYAERDLEDIRAADAVLFFAEEPSAPYSRGGRHVEFGYALATGKKVRVIGPEENVFHGLPGIAHYKSFDEWLSDAVKEEACSS